MHRLSSAAASADASQSDVTSLGNSLVIGIASSALFDLTESDLVFRTEGRAAYERYQDDHLADRLTPGTAFAFIQRLLGLNDLQPDLVEVIVLSRNSPKSGLRVMESIRAHGLPISRAIFREGLAAHEFMPDFNMSLFLSANQPDVVEAVASGHPAGQVLPCEPAADDEDGALRLAFDFDGVLADDSSERYYQARRSLDEYQAHEATLATQPLGPGPLKDFLAGINRVQQVEQAAADTDPGYHKRVRVSLITARNAPAHERAIRSLEGWGVRVDDAFFLGGIPKTAVLNRLRPHIFFDDQLKNLADPQLGTPAVHIPFGIHNSRGQAAAADA